MRAIYVLALSAAMAASAPALAQTTGSGGTSGSVSSPSGSSGTDKMRGTDKSMTEQRAAAPDATSQSEKTPPVAVPAEQNGQDTAK